MKSLPIPTGTRLQGLLDEGDVNWFAKHPREQQRHRFYFRGEQITGDAPPARYVVVTRAADGTLTRRFIREEAAAS